VSRDKGEKERDKEKGGDLKRQRYYYQASNGSSKGGSYSTNHNSKSSISQ
jgi:hypothetical protein